MNASPLRGVLLVLLAAVLWGTTGTAQSFATAELSSYWIGTFRLGLAAAFFGVWALWLHRRAGSMGASPPRQAARASPGVPTPDIVGRHSPPPRLWFVIGAAASMALYNLAFFAGVRASSVALGTAVALGSGPIWAGLMQTLASRRPPPARWWLGVGVAAAGLALASSDRTTGSANPVGLLLCLVAGLGYALYARFTKRLVSGPSLVAVTGAVFGLAALGAAPIALALAGLPRLDAHDAPVLLWLGFAGTGLAYYLFGLGLRLVPSATAVALGMAEPVAAVGFAVAVVGERPGALTIAGLAGVLAGLALLARADSDPGR